MYKAYFDNGQKDSNYKYSFGEGETKKQAVKNCLLQVTKNEFYLQDDPNLYSIDVFTQTGFVDSYPLVKTIYAAIGGRRVCNLDTEVFSIADVETVKKENNIYKIEVELYCPKFDLTNIYGF